jgi:hypothetical protein
MIWAALETRKEASVQETCSRLENKTKSMALLHVCHQIKKERKLIDYVNVPQRLLCRRYYRINVVAGKYEGYKRVGSNQQGLKQAL